MAPVSVEMLDLVDENDEVIGQVSRKEANANPNLRHREIVNIVYDDVGQEVRVLIQKRSRRKTVFPNHWTASVAGHVPQGWTYEAAAQQELEEELGLHGELERLEKVLTRQASETHFATWYKVRYSGEPVRVQEDEVAEVRWVNLPELKAMYEAGELFTVPYEESPLVRFWPSVSIE